jgi:signal transduction histidine kinase
MHNGEMRNNHTIRKRTWWSGLLIGLTGTVLMVQADWTRQKDGFETKARIMHRLLSQQVVQHDAVLTTLAVVSPQHGHQELGKELQALYPQITAMTRRASGALWPHASQPQAEAASRQQGRAVLTKLDDPVGRYTIVMAAGPNAYALQIDLLQTVPWAEWPLPREADSTRVTLDLPEQPPFVLHAGTAQAPFLGRRLTFEKHLASDSQPFKLVVAQEIGWGSLPWAQLGIWWVGVLTMLQVALAWERQSADRRRAHELLRLGQVTRLNTLGELAAGVAHELNQPLTAVLANTQAAHRLLQEEPPDLPTAQQAMSQASQQARRAADVVGRLRRLLERPDTSLTQQEVDLNSMVRHALSLLEPEFRARQAHSHIHAAPAVRIQADPVALEQIVHNLLMNALQALEKVPVGQRHIDLRLERRGTQGWLMVTDTGPGIEAHVLPQLFQPFVSTKPDGLGLGLSLCETLASSMGGSLKARNVEPHGAEFTLALPCSST